MSEIDAVDDLALQPFFDVCANRPQPRYAVDHIDRQVEAIHLIQNRELQRSVNVAFFLISAHMNVLMVPAQVRELVNQRRVGMKVKNDRLVGSKQGVEVTVAKPMR